MFRPGPETPFFQHVFIRQILATLLILAMVVGILLVFSLDHQSLIESLTEGREGSSALSAAVGDSRRNLITITLLLFFVGGAGITAVVTYLHYANTKENLEEVKGLARHILESIPTGVLTVSEDGVITAANPTAETILERTADSLLGKHYGVVFGEGHPIQVILAQILNHGGSMRSKEITFDSKKGEVRTIRISNVNLTGDDGKPAGMLFQLHDVTEWLALEKRVNEAQRLTALHTLSAGVAHELRNPLSALDLNLHLLEEELRETTALSSRTNDYFKVLNTELSRLSAILDNIMRYAQSRPSKFQEVNIQSLVSHVAQLLQLEAEDRNQKLQVSVPTNLPDVQGDETQIAQALINIVINAFQAMSVGGICRIIVQERARQERRWVEIAVHDTGQGIDPQSLVHIFDPFYTTKETGTGLGLAVAHRILQNHGGRIDVTALPGNGTSVTLSLPVCVNARAIPVEDV
ncbi:two-component system sensor histidine kinase NtrB [Nitrospira sp. T9]|uniref:two-component system sensor histidine kinase NtrB n=1 Tax=unclassified Nitrospira TaxID=2652172 RepID=UPI003F9720FD